MASSKLQKSAIIVVYFIALFTNTFSHFISTETMEAENYSDGVHLTLFRDCPDETVFYVGSIEKNTVLRYEDVEFASGVYRVTFQAVNFLEPNSTINIAMHLGNVTEPPFAVVPIDFILGPIYADDGRCNFHTFEAVLENIPNGVKDLVLSFPEAPLGGFLHLDWFKFNATAIPAAAAK